MKAGPVALAAAALVAGSAPPATADERPDTGHLVLAGVAMVPPTYVLGVTMHEGSHALAAELLGLDITSIRLYPGVHPRNQKFYFGWVDVRGIGSRGERTAFLVAPKINDAVFLGGYAALVLTGTVPDSRYGQLALAVVATGFWIDFARDTIAWWPHNDTVRIYDSYGLDREWKRLPFRLVHAGLAALAALPIAKGYRGVFATDGATATPIVLPLWDARF